MSECWAELASRQQRAAGSGDPSFGDRALGARTGVRRTEILSLVNTALHMSADLLSRSWIRRKRRDEPAWRRRWKSSTSKG
jgi:hypothetical protein